MREILFRGKEAVNGFWVYGSLLITDDNTNDCFGRKRIKKRYQICQYEACDWNLGGWGFYDVLPETIGQFTGLTDKNGTKIFEGDIVRWVFEQHYWEAVISTVPNNKSNTLYAMETFHNCTTDDEGEFYTYKRSNSRNGSRNDIEYLSREREVIGNIHDTPELLK